MPNSRFCMSFLCILLAPAGIVLVRPDSNVFLIFAVPLPLAAPKHFAFLSILTRLANQQATGDHSKRRICTGKIFAAERAGTIVAAMLMRSAAAAIHNASIAFAWNGTYGIAYTSEFSGINRHLSAT